MTTLTLATATSGIMNPPRANAGVANNAKTAQALAAQTEFDFMISPNCPRADVRELGDTTQMSKGPLAQKRPADVIGNAVHVMRISASCAAKFMTKLHLPPAPRKLFLGARDHRQVTE